MLTEASTMPSLLPSTSRHSTPTYPVETLNLLQRKKSSTSKANLSMWRVLKRVMAACLVNNLKPHWVSLLLMPNSRVMTILNTKDMNLRYHLRSTLPSPSANLREPTTITSSLFFFSSSNLFQTCSSSLNVVAPSASTISEYYPRTNAIPARTAPPFPLFFGYSTTTRFKFSFSASLSATSDVLSLLPSLTTII